MKNEDRFLLTLLIDGRKYPLRILRSEEEAYRSAANKIDNKINQYRVKYGNSSDYIPQDFMAMTALQILVKNFSLEDKNYTQPYEDKISSLIAELDKYLEK